MEHIYLDCLFSDNAHASIFTTLLLQHGQCASASATVVWRWWWNGMLVYTLHVASENNALWISSGSSTSYVLRERIYWFSQAAAAAADDASTFRGGECASKYRFSECSPMWTTSQRVHIPNAIKYHMHSALQRRQLTLCGMCNRLINITLLRALNCPDQQGVPLCVHYGVSI